MFQYTNTIVLNSLTDEASGLEKVQASEGLLKVLRVNNFKKDNVVAAYKQEAA